MERLWAPWRLGYIRAKKNEGCIFCRAKKQIGNNYIFIRNKYSFAILNIFPYNNGHAMVAPLRHIHSIALLKKTEILDLFKTLNQTKKRLDRVLRPKGYNIGINISDIAGAGIIGHLHIHIVPRWKGDTNFMPVIFQTKVISQSLEELYHRLRQ